MKRSSSNRTLNLWLSSVLPINLAKAAIGNIIAFQDLVIGATAIYLGFEVATLNRRHFECIPGLNVVTV